MLRAGSAEGAEAAPGPLRGAAPPRSSLPPPLLRAARSSRRRRAAPLHGDPQPLHRGECGPRRRRGLPAAIKPARCRRAGGCPAPEGWGGSPPLPPAAEGRGVPPAPGNVLIRQGAGRGVPQRREPPPRGVTLRGAPASRRRARVLPPQPPGPGAFPSPGPPGSAGVGRRSRGFHRGRAGVAASEMKVK